MSSTGISRLNIDWNANNRLFMIRRHRTAVKGRQINRGNKTARQDRESKQKSPRKEKEQETNLIIVVKGQLLLMVAVEATVVFH